MVRIRYAELPVGLHVVTRSHGRYTIVYLLHGLTPLQRRAAITFARRSARIGQGPRLPAADLALALVADRVRTAARTVSAAMRRHPMLLLPPLVVAVSTAIVFVLLTYVTINVSTMDNRHDQRRMEAPLLPAQGGSGTGAAGVSQPAHAGGRTPDPTSPQVPRTNATGPGLRMSGQPSPGLQHIPPQLCRTFRQFGACAGS